MIELRQISDAEHLMIEVADTGIGIPEEQRHICSTSTSGSARSGPASKALAWAS